MSDSRISRGPFAALAALVTAATLSACAASGGNDVVDLSTGNTAPAAPAPTAGEATQAQAIVVPVSGYEYGYELIAPVTTGTYTFELINEGSMRHDLVIEGEGASGATGIIGSGETDSFTVELEPGTYTLYCSVGSHRAQGMEVTFSVA